MRRWYCALFLPLSIFLSLQINAQQQQLEGVKNVLQNHLQELRLTRAQLDNAIVSDAYTDPQSQIQYIYLQQGWQNTPVYNRIMTILLKDNKVLSSMGNFIEKLNKFPPNASAALQPDGAIRRTATYLKLALPVALKKIPGKTDRSDQYMFSDGGIAKRNIDVKLYWVLSPDSSLRLAWNVTIDVLGSPDWWNVRVDAITGEFIEKDNWTVYETKEKGAPEFDQDFISSPGPVRHIPSLSNFQARSFFPPTVTNAAYNVVPFPYESPKHHPLSVENDPWLKAGAGNPTNTNGWHFDGSVNYTASRGNNVYAYLDVDDTNAPNLADNWADTSTTAIPALTFNYTPNFNAQPDILANKRIGIANLFYWNNLMHDVFYQYGFTEPAGNFQADNLSRGGTGSDYVLAEGQDNSGNNNANFSTPVDGQRPRMQMYIWSALPNFTVTSPAAVAGNYLAIESGFSTNNRLVDVGTVTGQVVYYNDDIAGTARLACTAPTNVVTGKIALIDRGNCNFTVKVKNAQIDGAKAVIMVNNVSGDPIVMGGTDNTVTIPAIMISQADGALLAQQLANGVNVTMTGGIDLDGDLDNSVICHEYGHGISSRLTGGPANSSCLANSEKESEGWSDYIALMILTNWTTASVNDGALPRTIGTYANNEEPDGAGIRRFPYSTNLAINPLVYASSLPAESHNLGEYWCSALWEMTWEMVQVDGINSNIFNAPGTGGNTAALKLVLEGMKIQPCNPGFIDARNAILKADTIFFAAHYSCAIWKAFAKRGMGRNALQGSPNSVADQVPDFTDGRASITTQPANVSACTGGSATFNIAVAGVSLNYQWQESTNGGASYSDLSGANTSSLLLNNVTNGMNNYRYRCAINGICSSSTTSNGGILSVSPGPVIASQPVSTAVCAGDVASFSVDVTGTVLGFQWQESTDGGNSFHDLPANIGTAADLFLASVTGSMDNNLYRCNVLASCGTGLNSSTAILTVNSAAIIDQQPVNTSACPGDNATFSISSAGNGNTYQWQQSLNNGSSFSDISGATFPSLQLSNLTLGMNNAQYRCIVSGNCAGAVSAAGTLTVFDAPVIQTQPVDLTVCAESIGHFAIVATGPIQGYQWQESTDGGSSFADIPGATNPTLTIASVKNNQDGHLFRCVIVGNCQTFPSASAAIHANPLPAFTLGLLPASLCASDSAISVSASVNGGTWSNNIQGNKFNPANGNAGNNLISYSLTNDIGCTLTVSATVEINECAERHVALGPNAIGIYPNPSNGLFIIRVKSDLFKKLGVRVYGSEGKWIRTMSFSGLFYNKIIPVDLSALPAGTYFLRMNADGVGKGKTFGIVIGR